MGIFWVIEFTYVFLHYYKEKCTPLEMLHYWRKEGAGGKKGHNSLIITAKK